MSFLYVKATLVTRVLPILTGIAMAKMQQMPPAQRKWLPVSDVSMATLAQLILKSDLSI